VAGCTGGEAGTSLRRRRRRGGLRSGGLRGGGSFLGVGSALERRPGRDRGPGIEEPGGSNGLGGAIDNGRRRLDVLKHPLRLGQDALRDVVGVAGVGA
jgi:hypothetical protein